MSRHHPERAEASSRSLGLGVELPDLLELVPNELQPVWRLFPGREEIDDPPASRELARGGHRVLESKSQADQIALEATRLEGLAGDELDARLPHEPGRNEPVTKSPRGSHDDDGPLRSEGREHRRARRGDLRVRAESPENVYRESGEGENLPLGAHRLEKGRDVGSGGLEILLVRNDDERRRRRRGGDAEGSDQAPRRPHEATQRRASLVARYEIEQRRPVGCAGSQRSFNQRGRVVHSPVSLRASPRRSTILWTMALVE